MGIRDRAGCLHPMTGIRSCDVRLVASLTVERLRCARNAGRSQFAGRTETSPQVRRAPHRRVEASVDTSRSVVALVRVERFLDELEDPLLPGRPLVLLVSDRARLALSECQTEPPAGPLVERACQQRRVLRLLGELPVERR